MSSKKVIVIGAGFGGISAAALLAKEGHQVTVLEKNSQLGGRAAVLKKIGFTFDMGPSWYMIPEVFERWFAEFGHQPLDFLDLKRVDPQYRVFFGDGTMIDVPVGISKVKRLFESLENGAGHKLERYLAEAKLKYDLALDQFLYQNHRHWWQLVNNKQVLQNVLRVSLLGSLHAHISRFFMNPKLQQILEYSIVFLGCSPYNAPALFSLMAHADFQAGVWYPHGGINQVVKAMTKVAKKQGVTFKLNQEVTQIKCEGGKVVGVKTTARFYQADIVVSAADYAHTEQLLSDSSARQYRDSYWQSKTWTPSAFLIYLGVKGHVPEIAHHTLYFSDHWHEHFAEIFEKPSWPEAPSLYINNPSASDQSVAPAGDTSLMILVPVAAGLKETKVHRQKYAHKIISQVEQKMGVSLQDRIVVQETFSVSDFATAYHSFAGNALGGMAHTLFQSSVWRPRNQSSKLANLYFAGAGTTPGIGVPTAIISGHLVRDLIKEENDE